jgi:hypothetical protein
MKEKMLLNSMYGKLSMEENQYIDTDSVATFNLYNKLKCKRKCIRMFNKLRMFLKVFYIKWLLHQCHGLCIRCKYKNDCYSNFESGVIK